MSPEELEFQVEVFQWKFVLHFYFTISDKTMLLAELMQMVREYTVLYCIYIIIIFFFGGGMYKSA